MTAVDGNVFTAAQFNVNVRDNLSYLKTEMDGNFRALATAGSQYPVSTGANTVVSRTYGNAAVLTNSTTTAATYGAPSVGTVGPAVTLTTGTAVKVTMNATCANSLASTFSAASYAISGATTVAASDNYRVIVEQGTINLLVASTFVHIHTGLTAGSNTFTMQYRTETATSSTAAFTNRELIVEPLN